MRPLASTQKDFISQQVKDHYINHMLSTINLFPLNYAITSSEQKFIIIGYVAMHKILRAHYMI